MKGIAKNESLEVIGASKEGVKARKDNGQEVTLTSKQSAAYGVFEREKIEVSAGDRLLLQANWKEKGRGGFKATNGELVTVASVDGGVDPLRTAANFQRLISNSRAVTLSRLMWARAIPLTSLSLRRMACGKISPMWLDAWQRGPDRRHQ